MSYFFQHLCAVRQYTKEVSASPAALFMLIGIPESNLSDKWVHAHALQMHMVTQQGQADGQEGWDFTGWSLGQLT